MYFKLKKEARQFFEGYKSDVNKLETWKQRGIHENLLEKVDRVYVTYGKTDTPTSKSMKSLDRNKKHAKINFEINITDCDFEYYSDFDETELMDRITETIKDFIND